MVQVLLSIFRIYWSVLCAIGRSILCILMMVTVNLIFNAITGSTEEIMDKSTGTEVAGAGWLVYVIAALALVLVLDYHGAPGWVIHLAIAASVLGVLPVHRVFQRKPPPEPLSDPHASQTTEEPAA